MTLSEYIKSNRGNATALAEALGVHKTQVSNWVNDTPSPASCVAIEGATGGLVTRKDLRPDDWESIWPELALPPCNSGTKRKAKTKAKKPTPRKGGKA